MAFYQSDEAAGFGATPRVLADVGAMSARVRSINVKLTPPAGGYATGDHIYLGRLPPGARLLTLGAITPTTTLGAATFTISAAPVTGSLQPATAGLVADKYSSTPSIPGAGAHMYLGSQNVGIPCPLQYGDDLYLTVKTGTVAAANALRVMLQWTQD